MLDKDKFKINAIVVVSETSNSVIIHFDGFENLDDARDFSEYMVEELGITPLNYPFNQIFIRGGFILK